MYGIVKNYWHFTTVWEWYNKQIYIYSSIPCVYTVQFTSYILHTTIAIILHLHGNEIYKR